MEHKLITGGGEHWLGFARSKIRGIRNSALSYGTQKYAMPDDAEVEVRVVGDQEFIRITGSNHWDYLTWPTSLVKPRGEGNVPNAVMTLTAGGIKNKQRAPEKAEKVDWLSYRMTDKGPKIGEKSLSYNSNSSFGRYEPEGAYVLSGGNLNVYRDGKEVKTSRTVKGAGIYALKKSDGTTQDRIIYANYEFGFGPEYGFQVAGKGVVLYYINEKERDEFDQPLNVEFARFAVPLPRVLSQPFFFDGQCSKGVCVLETQYLDYSASGPSSIPLVSYGAPYYRLRAHVSTNDSGEMIATFEMVPLGEHPTDDLTFSFYDPPGFYPFTGGGGPVTNGENYGTTVGDVLSQVAYPDGAASFSGGVRQFGDSTSTSGTRVYHVMGLDMTPDGQELLLEQSIASTNTNIGLYRSTYESSGVVSFSGGSFRTQSSRQNYELRQITAVNLKVVSLLINGGAIYTREAFRVNSVVNETRTSAATFDLWRTPAEIITESSYTPGNSTSVIYRDVGFRDIDARWKAVVAVEGEHEDMIPNIEPLDYDAAPAFPYKARLLALFNGEEYSKEFFNGSVKWNPPGSNDSVYSYRMIASRRPGEVVICATADSANHGDGIGVGYFRPMSRAGGLNRDPLIVLKRGDKIFDPTNKFRLGMDENFRLDPVHVI